MTRPRRSKGNPDEVAHRIVKRFEKNLADGDYDEALRRLKRGIADCIKDARSARFRNEANGK